MECNHKELSLQEEIPALHVYTLINGELDVVLSIGNGQKHSVLCYSCGRSWNIDDSSPDYIKHFYKQIISMIKENNL